MLIYKDSQASRLKEDLPESLLEGLSLSKISGKCKADPTAILDLFMARGTLIRRGCIDVIAFFLLALGYQRDLGDFSSGQRTR